MALKATSSSDMSVKFIHILIKNNEVASIKTDKSIVSLGKDTGFQAVLSIALYFMHAKAASLIAEKNSINNEGLPIFDLYRGSGSHTICASFKNILVPNRPHTILTDLFGDKGKSFLKNLSGAKDSEIVNLGYDPALFDPKLIRVFNGNYNSELIDADTISDFALKIEELYPEIWDEAEILYTNREQDKASKAGTEISDRTQNYSIIFDQKSLKNAELQLSDYKLRLKKNKRGSTKKRIRDNLIRNSIKQLCIEIELFGFYITSDINKENRILFSNSMPADVGISAYANDEMLSVLLYKFGHIQKKYGCYFERSLLLRDDKVTKSEIDDLVSICRSHVDFGHKICLINSSKIPRDLRLNYRNLAIINDSFLTTIDNFKDWNVVIYDKSKKQEYSDVIKDKTRKYKAMQSACILDFDDDEASKEELKELLHQKLKVVPSNPSI